METKGEFSMDLKLGQVENFGIESMLYKPKDAASGARARAFKNGNHRVTCLVDGCKADLSNCRDYYRRHKVCELHSKTPQVIIGGHKQRFCQQCSRFHSLEEFDEGKRRCRKRLDGHNRRRRRKPQPEPLMHSASFLSNYQGTQLLPFSSTQIYQVSFIVKQDLFLGYSTTSSYKEGKQITLNKQNTNLQTLFRTSLTSSVHESPCALSLLSSPQTHKTHGNGLNQMVQPHSSLLMQPLGLSLHDSNSLEPVDSVLNPNGSDAPQLFPFQWE